MRVRGFIDYISFFLGVALIASACGAAPTVTRFGTLQGQSAFSRAKTAVAQHGGGLATVDAELGVLTTKWQHHTDLEDNNYYYRARVTVTKKGDDKALISVALEAQVCDSKASLGAMDQQCERTKQIPDTLASDFQKFSRNVRKAIRRTQ